MEGYMFEICETERGAGEWANLKLSVILDEGVFGTAPDP